MLYIFYDCVRNLNAFILDLLNQKITNINYIESWNMKYKNIKYFIKFTYNNIFITKFIFKYYIKSQS